MKSTLIFSDTHLESGTQHDPSYDLLKRIIQKEKFNRIIINGDFLDLAYISKWTAESPLLTEGKRLTADIELLKTEFKFMKKYAKEIIFLEGNHDHRLQRLIEKFPVLEGLVSLPAICSEIGITYIPTEQQPYRLRDDLFIAHGLAFSKYYAAGTVEKAGTSIILGHAHRNQQYTFSFLNGRPVTGYGLGCISSVNPNYVAGTRITGHSQSFGILQEIDSFWDMQTYLIKDHHCLLNGKLY